MLRLVHLLKDFDETKKMPSRKKVYLFRILFGPLGTCYQTNVLPEDWVLDATKCHTMFLSDMSD